MKISRFTVYSKIKQGREFVYHSTARSRSHEKVIILAKHKITETEKSACWEENDGEGKKLLCSQCCFHYEYFKTLLLYFKKYLGFNNLGLLRKMRKQAACCIVKKSNSIFFKSSLAIIYYKHHHYVCLHCEIKSIKSSVTRVI